MKKKIILCCAIVLLLITAGAIYRWTVGAPVIGTVSGAEWEHLTVGGMDYEIDHAAPVNGTDKGAFLGIATNGDLKFRIYSIKEYDEYLYCRWEWEGHIYKRIQ